MDKNSITYQLVILRTTNTKRIQDGNSPASNRREFTRFFGEHVVIQINPIRFLKSNRVATISCRNEKTSDQYTQKYVNKRHFTGRNSEYGNGLEICATTLACHPVAKHPLRMSPVPCTIRLTANPLIVNRLPTNTLSISRLKHHSRHLHRCLLFWQISLADVAPLVHPLMKPGRRHRLISGKPSD